MEIKRNKLKVGYEFDRYGGKLINGKLEDGGNFIAPMGASFESRALPPYYNNGGVPYNKYKVVKEIPDVAEGAAIPWFGQPGMGTQFKLEKSIDDLLKEGYIERIVETANQLGKALKKVVLGSDDLSQFAVNFRKNLPVPNHKGNVAVFEYIDNSGNTIKKAFTTEVGVSSHSEELAIDFFNSEGIPKANIKRIYSELEPCELAGHTCKAKLTENFPTSEKIFSYDYPGGVDNTVRTASVNQRYIDLEQLLK